MTKFDHTVPAGTRLAAAKAACKQLQQARDTLRAAGCGNAADYAQRALKSAEGAVRHAQRMVSEQDREWHLQSTEHNAP